MPKTPSFFRRSKKKDLVIRDVVIAKAPSGRFGFTVAGGLESNSFCFVELGNEKPHIRSGKLKDKDLILEVNKRDVVGESHKRVTELISETAQDLHLSVATVGRPELASISTVFNLQQPEPLLAEVQARLKKTIYSLVVPCTTRPPNKDEVQGKHYFFVSQDMFQKLIDSNRMLEYNKGEDGYLYGTILPTTDLIQHIRGETGASEPNHNHPQQQRRDGPRPGAAQQQNASGPSIQVSEVPSDTSSVSSRTTGPLLSHADMKQLHKGDAPMVQTLVLARGEGGRLGFAFDGGVEHGTLLSIRHVGDVHILSSTNRDLRVGDCLLAVDGQSVVACSSVEAEKIIAKCGDPVEITTTCLDETLLDSNYRISARDFLRSAAFNHPDIRAARADLRRDVYAKTIPYTTRPMREGEEDGKPYHFVSRERFEEMLSQDAFIEWGENNGHYYGTPRQAETPSSNIRRSASVAHLRRTSNFRAATFVLEKHRPDELLGMELLKGPSNIYVYRVTPGSPAHRAFVRPNMVLLSINGEDMSRAKLADARQKLSEAGSRVELYMRYDKEGQDKAVAAARSTPTTPLSKRIEEEEAEEARRAAEKAAEAERRATVEQQERVQRQLEEAAEAAATDTDAGAAANGDTQTQEGGSNRHLWGLLLAVIIAALAVVLAVMYDLPFRS